MDKEHFEMNNFAAEQLFFQNYKLHPTVGSEQIFLSLQKRKMTNALNCKRKLVYQSDFDSPETVGKRTGTIKLIFLFTFFFRKNFVILIHLNKLKWLKAPWQKMKLNCLTITKKS